MAKYVVATVDEIPSGGRKIVEVGGVSVGVFNLSGDFFALRNRCPHQGGPLCLGKLWGSLEAVVPGEILYSRPGEILACEWHGWEFDIRTGQSWCDPRRLRTRRFPVTVESGATLVAAEEESTEERVRGPYLAETFPVTSDGSYLVVEITG
jgi:nitrite reductase/ring-hydroxylating ferredoxin subunit